jgi:glycosyltransferase involved in cell wall biosynthesis
VSVWGTDVLEAPTLTPFHGWITRQGLRNAGAITATGLRLAEATLRYTPAGKPVTVIPYGVDLQLFDPGPRIERARLTVGAVARLAPEKGFEHLVRAFGLLRGRGYDLDLLFAGDGPSRPALERTVHQLGLGDHVRFAGEIAHDDVPAMLRDVDIFAMPSTWEGFGVSAIEASAMRLPVVASNIHGIPDVVVDGETGILVPPADAEALAGAIERLVTTPGLPASMGDAGRAFVEKHYDWRDNTRLMERLYDDMVHRRAA